MENQNVFLEGDAKTGSQYWYSRYQLIEVMNEQEVKVHFKYIRPSFK
jgi:hypothetical protein